MMEESRSEAPRVENVRHVWFSQAALDVTAERRRQIEQEGWTPEHDDRHDLGELAGAAATYALYRSQVPTVDISSRDMLEIAWPFAPEWWKPKNRRSDLVRAAALLIAEVERIDRAVAREGVDDFLALVPRPAGPGGDRHG